MPDPAARVSVVVVTHASAAVIGDCLRALPPQAECIVVDNASPDSTIAEVRAARPTVRVIPEAVNRGFGAGCNRGMEAASREFILLLNPDARPAPEALNRLVAAADRYPDAGILAPTIIAEDGRRARSWDAERLSRRMLPDRRDTEPWPAGPICAAFVSGACMLLRRASSPRFDESFFLYYEDDDLCAAVRTSGRSILLVPDAVVTHAGGRSSVSSSSIAWRKAAHMAWSRLHYTAKHRGVPIALVDARRQCIRHLMKAMGHALSLRPIKLLTDVAGLSGTLAWMRGRRPAGGARQVGTTFIMKTSAK